MLISQIQPPVLTFAVGASSMTFPSSAPFETLTATVITAFK